MVTLLVFHGDGAVFLYSWPLYASRKYSRPTYASFYYIFVRN